jgi:hypothetical protein
MELILSEKQSGTLVEYEGSGSGEEIVTACEDTAECVFMEFGD